MTTPREDFRSAPPGRFGGIGGLFGGGGGYNPYQQQRMPFMGGGYNPYQQQRPMMGGGFNPYQQQRMPFMGGGFNPYQQQRMPFMGGGFNPYMGGGFNPYQQRRGPQSINDLFSGLDEDARAKFFERFGLATQPPAGETPSREGGASPDDKLPGEDWFAYHERVGTGQSPNTVGGQEDIFAPDVPSPTGIPVIDAYNQKLATPPGQVATIPFRGIEPDLSSGTDGSLRFDRPVPVPDRPRPADYGMNNTPTPRQFIGEGAPPSLPGWPGDESTQVPQFPQRVPFGPGHPLFDPKREDRGSMDNDAIRAQIDALGVSEEPPLRFEEPMLTIPPPRGIGGGIPLPAPMDEETRKRVESSERFGYGGETPMPTLTIPPNGGDVGMRNPFESQYVDDPGLNSLYNKLQMTIQMGGGFVMETPEEAAASSQAQKQLEQQIIAAGGKPYQYFTRLPHGAFKEGEGLRPGYDPMTGTDRENFNIPTIPNLPRPELPDLFGNKSEQMPRVPAPMPRVPAPMPQVPAPMPRGAARMPQVPAPMPRVPTPGGPPPNRLPGFSGQVYPTDGPPMPQLPAPIDPSLYSDPFMGGVAPRPKIIPGPKVLPGPKAPIKSLPIRNTVKVPPPPPSGIKAIPRKIKTSPRTGARRRGGR